MKRVQIELMVLQQEHPVIKAKLAKINEDAFKTLNTMLETFINDKAHKVEAELKEEEKDKLVPFITMSFDVPTDFSANQFFDMLNVIESEYMKAFQLSTVCYHIKTESKAEITNIMGITTIPTEVSTKVEAIVEAETKATKQDGLPFLLYLGESVKSSQTFFD
jgi:hypothetical protein